MKSNTVLNPNANSFYPNQLEINYNGIYRCTFGAGEWGKGNDGRRELHLLNNHNIISYGVWKCNSSSNTEFEKSKRKMDRLFKKEITHVLPYISRKNIHKLFPNNLHAINKDMCGIYKVLEKKCIESSVEYKAYVGENGEKLPISHRATFEEDCNRFDKGEAKEYLLIVKPIFVGNIDKYTDHSSHHTQFYARNNFHHYPNDGRYHKYIQYLKKLVNTTSKPYLS